MKRLNWAGIAFLAAAAGGALTLAVSFLPFFMRDMWGPLWGPEWWPEGIERRFAAVGPLTGISHWASLAAVPVSAALVVVAFLLAMGLLLYRWRKRLVRWM